VAFIDAGGRVVNIEEDCGPRPPKTFHCAKRDVFLCRWKMGRGWFSPSAA